MPAARQTALVVPVPGVDGLLRAVAARYPHVARRDLPAHLTVLYPFVCPDELDVSVIGQCAQIVADTAPIRVRFTSCDMRPGLIYLSPVPLGPVQGLLEAFWARWPNLLPYGGKYTDTPAHISVAFDTECAEQVAIVSLVERLLPITSQLSELLVVVASGDGWKVRSRLPFTGR